MVRKVINNEIIEHPTLLLGLKAAIKILEDEHFTNVHKFYPIMLNPLRYPLEVNLHILHLYSLMIEKMPIPELLKIMMSKL